jgi:hypothetical protein
MHDKTCMVQYIFYKYQTYADMFVVHISEFVRMHVYVTYLVTADILDNEQVLD